MISLCILKEVLWMTFTNIFSQCLIVEETREQSQSRVWFDQRGGRVTVSVFSEVARADTPACLSKWFAILMHLGSPLRQQGTLIEHGEALWLWWKTTMKTSRWGRQGSSSTQEVWQREMGIVSCKMVYLFLTRPITHSTWIRTADNPLNIQVPLDAAVVSL